jgi:phospholipid-binding lipoprotein MlaA
MIKVFILSVSLMLSLSVYSNVDPFEDINQVTHKFNVKIDENFAVPIAEVYVNVMPDKLEIGVSNFVANYEDVNVGINNLLQGKIKHGLSDIGRLLINSTIGVVGFIDVASRIGLEKHDEDFGQTLGYWGFRSGPYIVLPFIGPSSLRDTLAQIPDAFLGGLFFVDHERTGYELTLVDLLETRARYLGMESLVIGDEYLFYRDAYFQNRDYEIYDGIIEDNFEGFDDFDDFENLD